MNKSNYNLLGLAYRARKVITGDKLYEVISNKQACLVVYASDAASNTKKKLLNKCNTYNIKTLEVSDREEISRAIGKDNCVAVAIIDEGFAKKFLENRKEVD